MEVTRVGHDCLSLSLSLINMTIPGISILWKIPTKSDSEVMDDKIQNLNYYH